LNDNHDFLNNFWFKWSKRRANNWWKYNYWIWN